MGKWSSEIFPAGRIALDLLPSHWTRGWALSCPLLGTVREEEPHCLSCAFKGTVLAPQKQISGTSQVLVLEDLCWVGELWGRSD